MLGLCFVLLYCVSFLVLQSSWRGRIRNSWLIVFFMSCDVPHNAVSIGTASANSTKSDNGCTSRIYFDNVGNNMTPTSYNVTVTSWKQY